MTLPSGLVAACYLVIFLCVWSLIACMGGEWTKNTARDAFIAAFVLFAMLGILILEALYV
jgi:uncharacterized membrane protein